MGSALIIWSKKPTHHKEILLNVVEAAYDAKIPFSLYGYKEYIVDEQKLFRPSEFVLDPSGNQSETFMICHTGKYEELIEEKGCWLKYPIYDTNKNTVLNDMYRLLVSEDIDTHLSFEFSYCYLKSNQEDFIGIDDLIIDWDTMKTLYEKGYSNVWCWQYIQ